MNILNNSFVKVSKRSWDKQYFYEPLIVFKLRYCGCLEFVFVLIFGDAVGKSSVGIILWTDGGWDRNALSGASHRSSTVRSTEACMSTQQGSKHTTTFRLIRATGCKRTSPANFRCWLCGFFFINVIEFAVWRAFLFNHFYLGGYWICVEL